MGEPTQAPRIGVLFVCHANICRSPLAEGIFRHLVAERGLTDRFEIDSAGTWAPDGARPHEHSVAVAAAHGIGAELLSQSSRSITPDDMDHFDHVLGMDRRNIADLERLRRLSAFGETDSGWPRVRLMRHVVDPSLEGPDADVHDPIGKGRDAYDTTYETLLEACTRLLDELAVESSPRTRV